VKNEYLSKKQTSSQMSFLRIVVITIWHLVKFIDLNNILDSGISEIHFVCKFPKKKESYRSASPKILITFSLSI